MLSVVLLLSSASMASQPWTAPARAHIPDRVRVELELHERGIPASAASYLGGETAWRSDEAGQTHAEHALRWLRLTDAPILEDTRAPSRAHRCAAIPGHDPIPGSRQVHLYRNDRTNHAAAELGAQPGLVLASSADGEIALVTLRPGDQILLVEATHNRSGDQVEHLELRRGLRRLTLTRDGRDPEVCYTQLLPPTD